MTSPADEAQTAAHDIIARAQAVGAGGDVEITALETALQTAVTGPAAVASPADLDGLMAAAGARVEALEQLRQIVPDELVKAAAELVEIEELVEKATATLELARTEVGARPDLVGPPDLQAAGDQSLGPWLARLQALAEAGDWEAAGAGLSGWSVAADACMAAAREAEEANAAPLARQNELRALLEAYRAKVGNRGRDEDGRVDRLYQECRDILYTAPCDVERADALVQEYMGAADAAVPEAKR